MASSPYVFPAEGLNHLLNIVPRGVNTVPTYYLGLFSTSWATISGYLNNSTGINIVLSGTTGNYVTEVSGGNYSRASVGNWGAAVSGTATVNGVTISGLQTTTTSGFTFTCNSGSWTVNGIFVASGSAGGSSAGTTTVVWYAPFSDISTVTVASGDSIIITPTWQSLPYPN